MIRKCFKLVLVLSVLICSNLIGDDSTKKIKELKDVKTDQDFNIFFAFYYLNPRPDLINNSLKFIVLKELNKDGGFEKHFVSFYSYVFKQQPQELDNFLKKIPKITDDDIYNICVALYFSNSNEANLKIDELVKKISNEQVFLSIKKIRESEPKEFLDYKQITPFLLDVYWRRYFVSGNNEYIKKIIAATKENKSNFGTIAVYTSAQWSLKANARVHRRIYNLCKSEYENADDDVKIFLAEVVKAGCENE